MSVMKRLAANSYILNLYTIPLSIYMYVEFLVTTHFSPQTGLWHKQYESHEQGM